MGEMSRSHRTFCVCVCAIGQIIMFSDLQCDYINPVDLCNGLNMVRAEAAARNILE